MTHAKIAKRLKPVIKAQTRDLVLAVRDDFVNGRLVRCSKCKDLVFHSLADVGTCAVCIYTVGRCVSCDGELGVVRLVMAHVRAFASKSLRRKYGDKHFDAKGRYARSKTVRSTLAIIRGGKR